MSPPTARSGPPTATSTQSCSGRCGAAAVGNRDARYITGFAGAWPVGASPDSHVTWVRDAWQTIRAYSTGGNYANFQLAEDDTARTAEAYGANFERLRRAKASYDPHNVSGQPQHRPDRRSSAGQYRS